MKARWASSRLPESRNCRPRSRCRAIRWRPRLLSAASEDSAGAEEDGRNAPGSRRMRMRSKRAKSLAAGLRGMITRVEVLVSLSRSACASSPRPVWSRAKANSTRASASSRIESGSPRRDPCCSSRRTAAAMRLRASTPGSTSRSATAARSSTSRASGSACSIAWCKFPCVAPSARNARRCVSSANRSSTSHSAMASQSWARMAMARQK